MPVTDDRIQSIALTGLFVRPEWFWQLRPPKVLELLKLMGAE
jgi:hypothetical protein